MVRQFIIKQLNKAGYKIEKISKQEKLPADFSEEHLRIINKVKPYTMTSPERIFGLIEAVKYIAAYKLEGDIVECGVWKGGSMLAIVESLLLMTDRNRHLYLYDTYEGMSEPSEKDISFKDEKAADMLDTDKNKENNLVWAYSTLDTVKKTMSLATYPESNIHYIKGKVEETIPGQIPEKIALLRLDTDWYESTKHELIHLFPRLIKGGALIIDDYGYWKGARKAVDEYIAENKIQILLDRLDDTGRIAIKQ
jgi:hypothetical protein